MLRLPGNDSRAWEALFATRTGRSDCLLIDALRARPSVYPATRSRKRPCGVLVAPARFRDAGSVPVLARYDGQRPLAPWLIRVFQNWHVSQLRSSGGTLALPEDDIALPLPEKADGRWHDTFCTAAREWLDSLSEHESLLLGLRWRYRLSQREISHLFGVHEGTISRQTDKLRDRCLEFVGKKLTDDGWTGDDIEGFILTELGSLLVDEPRLSADQLTAMLARKGKKLAVG